jgi:hypothetical protein
VEQFRSLGGRLNVTAANANTPLHLVQDPSIPEWPFVNIASIDAATKYPTGQDVLGARRISRDYLTAAQALYTERINLLANEFLA